MLEHRVIIEHLPAEGTDLVERRIFTNKGEMAQILNRAGEAFKHLVYWDLDSAKSGEERGHHYHRTKTEHFYVLTGELELTLIDLEDFASSKLIVRAGERVAIEPNIAHAFRSLRYSQLLEYSPQPYDPSDTLPYEVTA